MFSDNLATDNGANLGISGSAGWIRAYASGTNVIGTFTNNTYVNNKDDGTSNSITNATRSTLIISQNQGTITTNVQNCVFWNNKSRGANTVAKSIGSFIVQLGNITVGNSLDENNFILIPPANITNTVSTDPLFTDIGNNDFTLQSGSPAIDSGNNAIVTAAEDLLGNQRIFNTTVDMGVYEFGAPLGVAEFFNNELSFSIYPNPTQNVLNVRLTEAFEQAIIYNLMGAKILESTSTNINVSHLASGMYLIKVKDNNGGIATKRFIKQ